MEHPDEPAYYRRREDAERAQAEQAADPRIARIHLDLADRYAALTARTPARPAVQMAI